MTSPRAAPSRAENGTQWHANTDDDLVVVDAKNKLPEGVEDLDDKDLDNPLMASEYAKEIFEHLMDREYDFLPNASYMEHQDDEAMSWKSRRILVEGISKVHNYFKLAPESLFLAVNILDRYLTRRRIQVNDLRLVGATSLFIAAKYDDVNVPSLRKFAQAVKDITPEKIIEVEQCILKVLDWDLGYPKPLDFLRRISKADEWHIQSRTIGKYLLELSLRDYRFLKYRASQVAAGAMYLARLMLNRGEWNETISFYSGYTKKEVEPVYKLMLEALFCHLDVAKEKQDFLYKKYGRTALLKASITAHTWAMQNRDKYEAIVTDDNDDNNGPAPPDPMSS